MARPLTVGMPHSPDIGAGYTLRVTAIDSATGNAVAGVNITTTVIEAEGTGDLSSGDFVVGNPILLGIGL